MLFRYSVFTACLTLALIAAGGLVTSTGSGLSVPDWPLSYGRFFPPMIGGIRYEHTHRLVAAVTGLCTFALSLWLWRADRRPFMRVLALTASAAILAQAILGGLTVKFLLPTPISVAHACLGQTFFCLLCLIVLFQTREWREAAPQTHARFGAFFRLACTTAAFAYAQLVAGAVVRHTGGQGLVVHLFIAFFILVHGLFLNLKLLRDPALSGAFLAQTMLLNALLVGQLFLGLGAYILKYTLEKGVQPGAPEVLFATAHQTTGALILANLLVMCFRARRLFRNAGAKHSSEFLDLMKVRVTLAALATTLAAYLLASPASLDLRGLFHTLLGAFCIGGGANALNQYLERDVDKKMPRTADRPLPSDRLLPVEALLFGIVLVTMGLGELYFFVSAAAAWIGVLIFASYVLIYTPLKRVTALNTYVGALAGALPSLLGWRAAGGAFSAEAFSLFLILFLWQLPHFYAIAWVYRDDYEKGGLRMMPVTDPEGRKTSFQIALFCLLLVLASLLPFWVGLSGSRYLTVALVAGAIFMGLSLDLWMERLLRAKKFVFASIVYLFVIMVSLVADKV